MGTQIDALPHSCGSKQGLKIFIEDDGETISGFCFACDTAVRQKDLPEPYKSVEDAEEVPRPRVKTPEEVAAELHEVQHYPVVDIPARKLRAASLEKFDAKVALSEQDGKTPAAMYFPYTKKGVVTGYRIKTLGLEKNFVYSIGDMKEVDLFNWEKAKVSGAYRLIITEGEPDAVAVDAIYAKHGKDPQYHPAIVSLPYGAGQARRSLTKFAAEIKQRFKEVILCFDDDDPGRKAAADCAYILPDAMSVTLPYKDANECIIKGASKAAYDAISYRATKPKNTRIVLGEDLHETAKKPAEYGELTWPYPKLNAKTRGIFLGTTTYVGAGVKMGKSELLNDIAAHFIEEHDAKVFMAKPEETNDKTYKLLAGKIAKRRFHDPDVPFDEEEFDRAGEILRGKVGMLNIFQHVGWSNLKEDIIAAAQWGAKAVFVDPITNLTNGVASAEANTVLQGISQDLSAMAKDYGFAAFIFCHLKAPEGNLSKDQRQNKYNQGKHIGLGNCPHELGGDVLSSQFAGSRAMMRSCDMMLGLEGNKDEELDEILRSTRNIKILEDRNFGESGSFPVFWNKATTRFTEI